MGSGHPFPVPLKLILKNMWITFRFVSSIIKMPDLSAKREFLKAHGVPEPINFFGLHRPDVPWITQTTHAATIPVDFIPQNVTCTGPITLAAASAEDQDTELTQWIKRKTTVLINLGSAMSYSRTQTRIMAEAVQQVLNATDLQVLWKYRPSDNIPDFDWPSLVEPLEATGRVKATQWLSVDPFSLMETGHIAAFVTHGGANGFHESIAYVSVLSYNQLFANWCSVVPVFPKSSCPCGWISTTMPSSLNKSALVFGAVARPLPNGRQSASRRAL